MTDIAISVQNLSKCFQIYETPRDRLKQFFLPRVRRVAGIDNKQYFREFWALKDVSFEIKKGETIGIVGRNGSGKSTLLQLICGTLNSTSGTVQTNGRIAALLELGSGFNPEFTGRENVYMNAVVLGLSKYEIDRRFDDIAAFADIGQFIDQPVKTYSSGMIVRLAFAVAINVDPEILIVDEALSVGDELFQRKCFSRIETIKKKGATILFVSHSVSTINQLCNEVFLMDKGYMLIRGAPRPITRYYHQLLFANNEQHVIALIKAAENNSSDILPKKKLSSEIVIADYIDGLVPTTPLRYESQGGVIISYELQDENGVRVNVVSAGFSGSVKLVVFFSNSFNNVTFGFHLKSVTGLEVAGLSYPPPEQSNIHVVAGETIEVRWQINMLLAAGTYFFTFGVRSVTEEGFIDRIVDASVVKVIAKSNACSFGMFDISDQGKSSLLRIKRITI